MGEIQPPTSAGVALFNPHRQTGKGSVSMRVLIAADAAVHAIYRPTLEALGHTCLRATDGRHACTLLQESDIDVVISAWQLPDMDGHSLCRWVRAYPKPSYTVMILLTSLTDPAHLQAGIAAGAD